MKRYLCVAFLLGMAFVACARASAPPVESADDGKGWTYTWEEDQEVWGSSDLITNIPGTFTGADVAPIVGADTFHNNGIRGQNTISTNIEAGHVWDGHESLGHVSSRTSHSNAPSSGWATPAYDRHATWVGMMIGGRRGGGTPGIWQDGIAQDTDLRSGAIATTWNSPAYSTSFGATVSTLDFPYSATASGFGTADVINSSWGALGSGSTDSTRTGTDIRATIVDSLADDNPGTTFVVSAGNNGSATNTVGSPGAGYNGITVGALANDGSNNYDSIASFSSRGPQAYADPVNGAIGPSTAQRAAVDIAAPGTNLTSAFYGGQSGGNDPNLTGSSATPGTNLYSGGIQGTSFSAPIAAGGVALMHSGADAAGLTATAHDARVVKANLLNSARKIPGWDNGQSPHPNGNGGVLTTQALDFDSGTGALALDRTYNQYLQGETDIPGLTGGISTKITGWDFAGVDLGDHTDIILDSSFGAGSELRATLAWFRERDYTDATNQTDVGFADLNLQVWDSTFSTLYSESSSTYTPVEHLAFTLPVSGQYGLRVDYPTNVFGGLTSETFGVAWHVPEPGGFLMLILGGLMVLQRRRSR